MKTYKQYPKAPKDISKMPPNEYFQSWRPLKKLVIKVKNSKGEKIVHFGDTRYKDYTQHKDKVRRDSYLKRAKGIKNKKGELTWKDPFSPNYHAVKVLWP